MIVDRGFLRSLFQEILLNDRGCCVVVVFILEGMRGVKSSV